MDLTAESTQAKQRLAAVESDLAATSANLKAAKLESLALETRLDTAQNEKSRKARPATAPGPSPFVQPSDLLTSAQSDCARHGRHPRAVQWRSPRFSPN